MNYKAKHLNLNTQYFTPIHLRMIENLYIFYIKIKKYLQSTKTIF